MAGACCLDVVEKFEINYFSARTAPCVLLIACSKEWDDGSHLVISGCVAYLVRTYLERGKYIVDFLFVVPDV